MGGRAVMHRCCPIARPPPPTPPRKGEGRKANAAPPRIVCGAGCAVLPFSTSIKRGEAERREAHLFVSRLATRASSDEEDAASRRSCRFCTGGHTWAGRG